MEGLVPSPSSSAPCAGGSLGPPAGIGASGPREAAGAVGVGSGPLVRLRTGLLGQLGRPPENGQTDGGDRPVDRPVAPHWALLTIRTFNGAMALTSEKSQERTRNVPWPPRWNPGAEQGP